jgi:RND family efflux transporter MFP subunit
VAGGVVAAGVVTRVHDTHEAQSWSDARSIPVVHLIPVGGNAAQEPLTLPGTMQAWVAANIYARVPGYLRGWDEDIGNAVKTGTPLGRIDTPELDQQIAQARAGLVSAQANARFAKTTAARWNDLLTDHSVSEQEADEKNADAAVKAAAVQAARADLGRLLALKGFSTLRAPFAGIVTARSADIGDLVGPGASGRQPLFSVAQTGRIRVYVSVPQSYSAAMTPGVAATLTVPDFPGRTFTGRVIGNAGAVDPQSGTFQVQLAADNPDGALKPGGFARVRFDIHGGADSVTIPSSAIVFRAAGTQVATVGADGHVAMRPITIGRDLGQTVEVASGLHAGERIVDNPPDSIAEHELVRVAEPARG